MTNTSPKAPSASGKNFYDAIKNYDEPIAKLETTFAKRITGVIDMLDKLDNKEGIADGVLHLSTIETFARKYAKTTPELNKIQALIDKMHAKFGDAIPEAFTVNTAAIQQAVHAQLLAGDTDGNGRLNFKEAMAASQNFGATFGKGGDAQVISVLKEFITPLPTPAAAIPKTPAVTVPGS